jgi:hypothetical protein
MSRSNRGEYIVSRQELIRLCRDFLESVAVNIQAIIRPLPKRFQQSMWMVSTGSGNMRGLHSQREIIDIEKVSIIYHSQIENREFPEKARLREFLKYFDGGMLVDFSSQLVMNWLKLPNPFSFEEPSISSLLDEFVDVVLDRKMVTKSLTIVDGLNAASLPIDFEEGITIRQITNNELWMFGDIANLQLLPRLHIYHDPIPSETWKRLDIKIRHDVPEVYSVKAVNDIRDAVLTFLRLESSGTLTIIDMGSQANYVFLGRFGSRDRSRMSIGRCETTYTFDAEMIQRIQDSWLTVRKIMETDTHYLRLPAQRLFEGSERRKQEDAILDYAIGLERLLTAGEENELRYRFSLRGATILSWESGDKRTFYKNLRDFYDLRSYIVHGSRKTDPPALNPRDACSNGENYLRKIWWWYVKNGFTNARNGLSNGTTKIDSRILGDEVSP